MVERELGAIEMSLSLRIRIENNFPYKIIELCYCSGEYKLNKVTFLHYSHLQNQWLRESREILMPNLFYSKKASLDLKKTSRMSCFMFLFIIIEM